MFVTKHNTRYTVAIRKLCEGQASMHVCEQSSVHAVTGMLSVHAVTGMLSVCVKIRCQLTCRMRIDICL